MMRHISQTIFSPLLVLFCLFTSSSQAAATNAEPAKDQQQLQSVLKKLDQATKQRQQQQTRVEELSRRLECNWTLIRAYKVCGELHGDDPAGHLQCSEKAKQNAARCLEEVEKK
jgi:hypothetical protein